MPEMAVVFEPGFDPRPDWFKKLEEAVKEEEKNMLVVAAVIVFVLDLILHLAGFHSSSKILDETSLLYLGLALFAAHFIPWRK